MAGAYVKCAICNQVFDRDKVPWEQIGNTRYAHKTCAVAARNGQVQALKDKEALEKYILQLLGEPYISPRVKRQMNSYMETYKFTYSGMLRALKYFYEVLGNDKSRANGGIGIIPYVYREAYNYYYSLWLAKQKNKDKVGNIEDYKPTVKEVRIPSPQPKRHKKRQFNFFEEDK